MRINYFFKERIIQLKQSVHTVLVSATLKSVHVFIVDGKLFQIRGLFVSYRFAVSFNCFSSGTRPTVDAFKSQVVQA